MRALAPLVAERLLATSAVRRIKVAAMIAREQRERSCTGIPAAVETWEGSKPLKGY